MNKNRLNAKIIIFVLLVGSIGGTLAVLPNAYAATAPVPGASVTADGTEGFGDTTSDAFGFYNITQFLDTGNYSVSASATGFVDTTIENVLVTAGSETTNVNVLMPVSGGISGKITDAVSSSPIQGVFVDAEIATGSIAYGSGAVTDAGGNYQIITNLITGTYNVTATYAPGHISKKLTGVSVTAGLMTNNVNIALDRSATISGTVTDSVSSTPLQDIIVLAVDSNGDYAAAATTNSSGKYTLNTDLATGTYNITTLFPLNHVSKTVADFAVTAGSQYTVNLSLDPSGIISGRITSQDNGQPLANASVLASSGEFFGVATTNDTGYYRITSGLGTGSYMIFASYGSGFNFVAGISVTQGQETSNVNLQITLAPSGAITGKVTDTIGTPIQYAFVEAEGLGGFGSDITDANGNYAIVTGLGSGTYNVTATATGYVSQVQTGVNVVVSQVTPNIDFHLAAKPSGRISGQILTDSTPIPEMPGAFTLTAILTVSAIAIIIGKMKPLRLRSSKPI